MTTAERPILICFDDSPEARRAVLESARLFPGANAIVLHVWQSLESTVAYRYSAARVMGALTEELEELKAPSAATAEAIAERGALLARQAGLRAEALAVEADQHMHAAVASVVEDVDASLVVVGSRRLGAIQSIALGGFSAPVVRHSRRPVMVASAHDQ